MEIIHIIGHSCAGKRELILKLCDESRVALRDRFDIRGATDSYMSDGAKADGTDIGKREFLPVSQLYVDQVEHMLHKWQFLTDFHLLKLKRKRPSIGHRAVVLWRTIEDSRNRILDKSRHFDPGDKINYWMPTLEEMKPQMEKLWSFAKKHIDSGMNVEIVDAATENYDRMGNFAIR